LADIKTACALLGLGLATLIPAGAQAAKAPPRGGSCAHPFQVSYTRGKVVGDAKQVFLAVAIRGNQITITWHAQKGYRFCGISLLERRGQIFRSANPSASYRYTDLTRDHSNGIKTLTATARR
jgi:hypothetical protein